MSTGPAESTSNLPLRERIAYQAGLLGLVTLTATLLLVVADQVTRGPISERRAEDLAASLAQVIPASIHDNDLATETLGITPDQGLPVTVYRAVRQGQVTGVAFQVAAPGYSGEIAIILGLDHQGRILGTRVLAHTETPGLGDKIEVSKDEWILAFDGRSLGDPPADRWAVKKDGGDFDQFSGATITPRAVVRAVKDGLELFRTHRDTLTTPPVHVVDH